MLKLGMVFVTLVIPEIATYMVRNQGTLSPSEQFSWWRGFYSWRKGKQFYQLIDNCKCNCRVIQEPNANPDVTEINHRWTVIQGYYAAMGGFVFEIGPINQTIHSSHCWSKVTSSADSNGSWCSSPCQMWSHPIYTRKSKADSFLKALVCFQAVGRILQIVARLVAHFSITLLEINTLGHVLCALTLHLCWWFKLLDISVRTVLSGDWLPPLCADMWMSRKISGDCPASKPGKPEKYLVSCHGVDWGRDWCRTQNHVIWRRTVFARSPWAQHKH